MKFKTIKVKLPEHDCDVVLTFPSGKQVLIQARPSNADRNYNGSLDIVLPEDTCVTNWAGDDMAPAPCISAMHRAGDNTRAKSKASRREHERLAKQLVMELP